MTQILQADGLSVPVTLVKAGPCTVVQVKTVENDGYSSIQLGFEESASLNKAQIGHAKKSKSMPKIIKEFRNETDDATVEVGSIFNVETFAEGDLVMVSSTSKGKGFAGTIKRHNFARGPMTHGSRNVRKPGSIGSMYPQKVYKGRKMAGQMGGETVSIKNQKIALVDAKNNIIGIKGNVPGAKDVIVTIFGGQN